MEENYTIVALSSPNDLEENFPWLKWKKRMPAKLYQYCMLKKLPMKQEEVFCMGVSGLRVSLPFTLEELDQDREFFNRFLNIWKKRTHIDTLILEPEIRKKLEPGVNQYGWAMGYFLFPQIFQKVITEYEIDCKKMKLVLVDSGDTRTDYLLELLLPYLNYLTIVTTRSHYFEGLKDDAYEETGLMVEVLEIPLLEPIQGTFILCAGERDSWQGIKNRIARLEAKTIFLFLAGELEDVRGFGQRRSDLTYIYDVEICVGEKSMDKAIAAAILGKVDWRVKGFLQHKGRFHYVGEAEKMIERYKISLKKMCIFHP